MSAHGFLDLGECRGDRESVEGRAERAALVESRVLEHPARLPCVWVRYHVHGGLTAPRLHCRQKVWGGRRHCSDNRRAEERGESVSDVHADYHDIR